MEKQNDLEKLFREKLEGLEIDPGKKTWSNVKAGLGAATTGAVASQVVSSTSWTASIVAGTIITVTAVGGYFLFDQQGAKQKNDAQQIEQTIEEPNNSLGNGTDQNEAIPLFQEDNQQDNTTLSESNSLSSDVEEFNASSNERGDNATAGRNELLDHDDLNNHPQKTIEEIIADSQAQFEANIREARRLEEIREAVSSSQKQEKQKQRAVSTPSDELKTEKSTTRANASEEDEDDITKVIEFPNAFTPNFDGINDIFSLGEQYRDKIDNIAVYIYSSSNTIIHDWKVLNGGWDGTLSDGSPAPEGVYFYNAILTKDGVNYRVKGNVNLKR